MAALAGIKCADATPVSVAHSVRHLRISGITVRVPRYICALLIAAAALHTPVHAADLMEIYREALEQDTLYSAARHAHEAAQEQLPQGRAGLLPTVSLAYVRRRQFIDIEKRISLELAVGAVIRPSKSPLTTRALRSLLPSRFSARKISRFMNNPNFRLRRRIRSSSSPPRT